MISVRKMSTLKRNLHIYVRNYKLLSMIFIFVLSISYLVLRTSKWSPSATTGNKISKKKVIFVFSSVGRSGSTFTIETLSSRNQTVTFFEPDSYMYNSSCLHISNCLEAVLTDLYTCHVTDEFINWMKIMPAVRETYHPLAKNCGYNKECLKNLDLNKLCENSDFVVSKAIRVRLGLLEPLFNSKLIDFKLIYLMRDPRANAASISKYRLFNYPISLSVARLCSNYFNDIIVYETFRKLFPGKVFHLLYERMSLNLEYNMKEVFKFAFGDDTIPESSMAYLKQHTHKTESGGMNTVRKTNQHFQEWRKEIRFGLLNNIEHDVECLKVIKYLGHNKFESIEKIRNLEDYPLFLN